MANDESRGNRPPLVLRRLSFLALVRAEDWWFSKIPPLLGVSFATTLLYDIPAPQATAYIALIVVVGMCAGTYGHLINDLFDLSIDRRAGRRVAVRSLLPWQRLVLGALTIVLGFAPALLLSYSHVSLALLALVYLLPTLYSVPPVRLKERGLAAIFADALGAHAIPTLYVISVLAYAPGVAPAARTRPAAIALVVLALLWSLFLGLKGIVLHQWRDRSPDIAAGITTLVTRTTFERLRVHVQWLCVLELLAFVGLVIVLLPFAPGLAFAAVVYVGTVAVNLARRWNYFSRFDQSAVMIEWWWLANPFYERYFPSVLALHLAVSSSLILAPVLVLVLFFRNVRIEGRRLMTAIETIRSWTVWHGRLDLDGAADAHLSRLRSPSGVTRIEIARPEHELWHIRLVTPNVHLQAGRRYRVSLEIRAERERRIALGVWQDHDPWESLGLYQEHDISSPWSMLQADFTAVADDARAYLGTWVGGSEITVDVRRSDIVLIHEE